MPFGGNSDVETASGGFLVAPFMTIQAVELSNFKGISAPVRLEMRPLTLLFGANSAGKSSVLQALLYTRELLGRRNIDPDKTAQGGEFVDLGGFLNLVHDHNPALPVILKFDLDLSAVDLIDYFVPVGRQPAKNDQAVIENALLENLSANSQTACVALEVKWGTIAEFPVQADYLVEVNGTPAARVISNAESSRTYHSIDINPAHPWFSGGDIEPSLSGDRVPVSSTTEIAVAWQRLQVAPVEAQRTSAIQIETILDEIRVVLSAHDLEEFPAVIPFILLAPGEYLLRQLKKLRYLGPIRDVPSRNYRPRVTPDESRWANGLAAWDWLHRAFDSDIARVNSWLTKPERLNCGYRVEVKRYKELDVDSMLMLGLMEGSDLLDNYPAIRSGIEALPTRSRVTLRREEDFLEVGPQDVGIGISQMIPVIVAALERSERLSVIEQPELHIHPALQVALGDLFIEAISRDGERDSGQFLIETHSEHLLLRLLRRLRETTEGSAMPGLALTADQVAIYFVEATSSGTEIKLLELNDDGTFQNEWPRGFFEEREREFFGERGAVSDEDLNRLLGQ